MSLTLAITLVTLLVKYGPQIIAVVKLLGLVIGALAPEFKQLAEELPGFAKKVGASVNDLIGEGLGHGEALTTVAGWISAPHKMTDEERERWYDLQGSAST